jgi:hypothetical protein
MMKWVDIAALYRYWRDSPPVHELVAVYLKYRPPDREVDVSERPDIGMTYKELERAMAAGTPLFQAGV